MLILKLAIDVQGAESVSSPAGTVCMVRFGGRCEGPVFTGEILPGGVDTQRIAPDGTGTLSARYMLSGTAWDGTPARLFIENNAVLGAKDTQPVIRTDCPSLRYLEETPLVGHILAENDKLTILIETR